MSQQEAIDGIQMEVDEEGQNQAARVIAPMVQSGQAQSAVFKLDADCWDEVFDCLSLEDIHSFGQTCKAFQRVTGEYFKWKYEAVTARCFVDGIYMDYKQMNGFSAFIQKIEFYGISTEERLRYVESNCKSIKRMKFGSTIFNQLNFELIKSLFTKLEELELCSCEFDRDVFGALIESCVNLKRITFWRVGLPVHGHPTLEHLKFYPSGLKNNKLKTFLEQSPNLQSLEISAYHLCRDRQSILKANVELNDLTIHLDKDSKIKVTGLVMLLNEFYQQSFYKRLHLFSNVPLSSDQLLALPGLVTLDVQWRVDYQLMVNIKELVIDFVDDINPTDLTSNFINVEQIFTPRATIGHILPFVRRSAKLKAICIDSFEGGVLDIRTLNKERKNLLESRMVTIYVDEETYLATKWASKGTTLDLIEIRRRSSYNIIRPYSFRWKPFDI